MWKPRPQQGSRGRHAGAVEEAEDQQGLAHVVEHVTFLGSKKRERLLGTGARSNAYTDFHHTVFHVHSPLHNAGTGQPLLPQVGGPRPGTGCAATGAPAPESSPCPAPCPSALLIHAVPPSRRLCCSLAAPLDSEPVQVPSREPQLRAAPRAAPFAGSIHGCELALWGLQLSPALTELASEPDLNFIIS